MTLFLILSLPLLIAWLLRSGLFKFKEIEIKPFLLGFFLIVVFYIFFYIFVRDLSYYWDNKTLYVNAMKMLILPFSAIFAIVFVMDFFKVSKSTKISLLLLFYLIDNTRLLILADTRFSYIELIIIPLLRIFLVLAFILFLYIQNGHKDSKWKLIYLGPVLAAVLLHSVYYLFLTNRIEYAVGLMVIATGAGIFGYKRCGLV